MNFLDLYKDYANQVTDCPADFHKFMAIATAGITIGRSRFFQFGHQQIFPNLYLMILAPSSMFRKSTALSISQKMIREVSPDKIYPSDFSQEKISDTLSKLPVGAFYYYEFRTLMDMLNRTYMASAKSFLTELYDCNDMSIARKKECIVIKDPCVSIISATTADWFTKSITSGDIEGGFLSRFIFVYSKNKVRNDSIPVRADFDKWRAALAKLSNLSGISTAEMTLNTKARQRYDEFYTFFCEKYEEMDISYRTIFARINIACIKIAMILETCYTTNAEISLKTMNESISICVWLINKTRNLCDRELSFSKSEGAEKKILRYLESKKEASRADVLRFSHLDGKTFDAAIKDLIDKEIVELKLVNLNNSQRKTQLLVLL